MRGTVHKIEGDEVHVKVGSGKFGDRIVKGKLKNATLLHQEELKVLPRPPTKKNPKPGHNPPGSPGSDPRAGFTTPTPRGRAPSPHKSYDGDNKKGNGSNGAEPHTIRSNAHVKENRSVVDRILEARKKVSEKSKKKTATGQPITTIDTKPEIDSVGNAGNFRKP
jgi:hypothetical protein